MKINCTFKKTTPSSELSEYAESRLERLQKFEMKPLESAHCIFKAQSRGEFEVEIILSGPDASWSATARGDNFFQAIDRAVEKASTQMSRKKDKVQHHKNPAKSREGHLEALTESLEVRPSRKGA